MVAMLLTATVITTTERAYADDTLIDAVESGKPLIDLRLRLEEVSQSTKPKVALATTLRARLGYQTGQYLGISALADFDFVQHLGPKQFNDSINGLPGYPVIADPNMTTLNRLQFDYRMRLLNAKAPNAEPDFKITVGRQRIVFGDGRYIGNADWRQHEQTFDALTVVETAIPSLTLSYAYVTRVNRVFGPDSPVGSYDSQSHFLNAVYSGLLPSLKLETYAYLIDLRQSPTLSSATYGLRGEEVADLGSGLTARFNAAYAHQSDYAENPSHFALSDYLMEAGLGFRGLTGQLGYEVLQGNGSVGFQTPLANLHPFQGWAETFLTKPPNGLRDFYVKSAYGIPAAPYFSRVSVTLAYHSFTAEHMSANYGGEWDAQLEAQLDTHLTFDAAYANYAGAGPFPDKKVFWLYATYRN